MNIKLAIIGVTGMVGQKMIEVLQEKEVPISKLIPVASHKSVGRKITFKNTEITVLDIDSALAQKPNIAIFSAGKDVSLKYAPLFAAQNCFVIDNSSAWRMHTDKKLIVPEINANLLTSKDKIIANPNCSTIQMVMALYPLHKKYNLKRLVVSTYQSVTGSGFKGHNQLMQERNGIKNNEAYPHQIDLNCLPQGGNFLNNNYTEEEMKLVHESRKIMNEPKLSVTATVVRVPVIGGHSMSINAEFEQTPNIEEIRKILSEFPGIKLEDDPQNNAYPMPINAHNKNQVFVGRLRIDESLDNAINMWVVSDNLRKGAATNAVQIAQYIISKELV